jgi:hypothetical protein
MNLSRTGLCPGSVQIIAAAFRDAAVCLIPAEVRNTGGTSCAAFLGAAVRTGAQGSYSAALPKQKAGCRKVTARPHIRKRIDPGRAFKHVSFSNMESYAGFRHNSSTFNRKVRLRTIAAP